MTQISTSTPGVGANLDLMAEIAAKAAEGNEGPRIHSGQSYRPANRTDQRVLKCLLNIGQHVGKSGSPTMVCFRNLSLRDKDQLKDRWVCTQGGFAGGSTAGHWNAWYADQNRKRSRAQAGSQDPKPEPSAADKFAFVDGWKPDFAMEAKSILVGGCGNLGKLKHHELELACGEALKSKWWTVAIAESVINANGRIGAMVDLVAAIVINIDKTTTELLEWFVPIEQVTQTIIDEAWSSPVGLLRRDVIGEDVWAGLSSAPSNELRLTMRREVLRILTLLYGLWLVPGPAVAAVGAVASAMSNPKPKAEAEGRRPKPKLKGGSCWQGLTDVSVVSLSSS